MSSEKGLSDVFKKLISTGIGAAFLSEEALRSMLKDLPLPKEIVTGLLVNAKQAKDEFTDSVKVELREAIEKIDPQQIVESLVEKYDIEMSATFRFKKKEDTSESSSSDIE